MIPFIIYFFMVFSLSTDAFSLAILLGTLSTSRKRNLIVSIMIGIFHFLMPLLGSRLGLYFTDKIPINEKYLLFSLFLFLAYEMYKNRDTDEPIQIFNLFSMILFSLTVSMDSFIVGIALGINKENIILAGTIFSLVSTSISFIGLELGKKLQEKYQKKTIYIGIGLMIIIAIKYLLFN